MLKEKLLVRVWISAKGKKSYALVYDLGYRLLYLSFSVSDIAEVLGISVAALLDYNEGIYRVESEE